MPTVGQLLESAVARLRAAGSESPRLDAELLMGHAVGADRTAIVAHPEAPVGLDAATAFQRDLERRLGGEPVAYIRGFKEFYGLAFGADRRALIPRPETEILVEFALEKIIQRLTRAPRPAGTPPIRIADVGTGAGTIAVALAVTLRRRGAGGDIELVATDISDEALQLARENAVGHGVGDMIRFELADLVPPAPEPPFDVVLANLPYVRSEVVPSLPVAASFEPVVALDGGADGLALITRLLKRLPDVLASGGVALLEIGSDQADEMCAAVARVLTGWTCRVEPDLTDHPRVAVVTRSTGH